METKHTPGPWTVDHNHPDDPETATIHDPSGDWVAQTCDANARLIAAAPDMLAALEMSLSVFDKQRELLRDGCKDIPCPRDEALDILRAAIAKATT